MALIDPASKKSVWRGIEYHKQNKVLSYSINEEGTCDGIVAGSEVHLTEKTIFDEVTLNHLNLKNRIVRSATWEALADAKGGPVP